jgi:protein-S-isoprenylcysteine O-methyltransferase Ste14
MVLTPVLSVLLLKGILYPLEITSVSLPDSLLVKLLDVLGLILYIIGNIFVYLTRIVLWDNFRLGAVTPESKDKLVLSGPFKLVRHPMYFAVIIMALGLALLLHSWLFMIFFIILFYTIVKMIPIEENQLINAYGDDYINYRKIVKKLFPYIY